MAEGRERVLQRGALARVRVDVAGGDGRHAEPAGQLGQRPVARPVVPLERPLELDPQPVAPEGGEQLAQRRLVVDPAPRAAAQAHEARGTLDDRLQRDHRRQLGPPHAPRPVTRVRVRARE